MSYPLDEKYSQLVDYLIVIGDELITTMDAPTWDSAFSKFITLVGAAKSFKGIKEIDKGNYITLEELERQLGV